MNYSRPAPSNMQPRYNIAPTQDVDFLHLASLKHQAALSIA